MITNPVNCMELSTIVVLHPSQLNNELYNNLKENLNIRILGRCYKDYGIINKIFEIKKYSGGQIFNEDIEAKVQFNVDFTCEVIRPIDGTYIITKINTNVKMCLTTEINGIITFIEPANLSDNYYINQFNSKIVYKKTNEELKKGDMVKIKIISSFICHNKTKIITLGFLEDNLTDEEIKEYYENKYNEELETTKEEPILLSRISTEEKTLDKKKFKFDRTLTQLSNFITEKKLANRIYKITILNNLSDIVDSINFLSPFAKMKDIVCICIKNIISEKYKLILSQFFKNFHFEFYQCFLIHKINKYKGKNILIISDIKIKLDELKDIKPLKVNIPITFDELIENDGKSIKGDIIIPPYTNKLRLYVKSFEETTYDIHTYTNALKNYYMNYNNTSKIYKDYLDIFKENDVETTFNNIMIYKILRFYNKNIKKKESKKETVKNVKILLKYFDSI